MKTLPVAEPPHRLRPAASVITATRGYSRELIERCVPSVRAQAVACEHVIVSERDDELWYAARELGWQLGGPDPQHPIRLVEVGSWNRDPQAPVAPGAMAYFVGTHLALGDHVGFCGDDDELLPDHLAILIRRILAAGADFAVSKVDFRVNGEHRQFVGDRSLALNKLDTIGIVCRGECFWSGRWRPDGGACSDHDLVQQWLWAGLRPIFVDRVTAVHHDGWLKLALESRGEL